MKDKLTKIDLNTIKFKTIQFINGICYFSSKQSDDLKHIVCDNLKIEKTTNNFKAVEDGIKIYFEIMNKKCSYREYGNRLKL